MVSIAFDFIASMGVLSKILSDSPWGSVSMINTYMAQQTVYAWRSKAAGRAAEKIKNW